MEPKQFRFLLWVPVIMGIALLGGLWKLGQSIESSRASDVITVTGSVKQLVTADLAKWQGSLSRNADLTNVKTTLDKVTNDAETVKKFITELGIKAEEVNLKPVQTDPIYEQLPGYGQTQKIIGYVARQDIEVSSNNVSKVEELAKSASKLAGQGIIFNYQSTEYYYTKLADLRPELFALATKDAKERAEAIAKGSGVKVGAPRSARTGVIQVLKPNSTDISDYGNYDLATKEKEINAVVTVTFALE